MPRLHFSLGPVQTFVAQARRTRDLWAGSFLLSYLVAHAMAAVRERGRIILPSVDGDPLLEWVKDERGPAPRLGSIPNRFVAEVDDGPGQAKLAVQALQHAWKKLADQVYEKYVQPVAHLGQDTQAIWQRQVAGFWEIQWAVTSDDQDFALLDRRKNWRFTSASDEGGDHCTIMGDYQELSGYVRAWERDKQDAFWSALRERTGDLELREDERLCAIALIKRLFPKAIGQTHMPTRWPSTAYVAAIPWIKEMAEKAPGQAKAYAEMAKQLAGSQTVGNSFEEIPALAGLQTGLFAHLDGNFFYAEAMGNPKRTPMDEAARPILLGKLKQLYEVDRPSPYLAYLIMDGDQLGKKLREMGPERVSKALSLFAQQVSGIVNDHQGVLVYAGGDDVLALMPMTSALACAQAINVAYRGAFGDKSATLSAAILYADILTPLRSALRNAHHLLDHVSKEQCGRDTVTLSVYKGQGTSLQWSSKWDDVGDRFHALIERIRNKDYSSGFFYNLREQFAFLTGKPTWTPGETLALPDGLSLKPFLFAEYARNRERSATPAEMEACIDALCQAIAPDHRRLSPDAALMARFLAQEGKREYAHH